LANYLKLSDNFAMNAEGGNDKGVDFYLGMCAQLVHIMKEASTCQWKIEFLTSDIVVVGKYYKRWGLSEANYVFFKNSPIVFLHVSHVKAIWHKVSNASFEP